MAGLSGLLCYICAFHERKTQGSSLGFNSPFASLTPLQVQKQFIYNVNFLVVLKLSFIACLVVVYIGGC